MNGTHSTHPSPPLASIAVSTLAPRVHATGPWIYSLLTHLTLLSAVLIWLRFDGNEARIHGEAGLMGAPGKRGTVMIDVSAQPARPAVKPPAPQPIAPATAPRLTETIPAHLPRELPRELPTRLKSEAATKTNAPTADVAPVPAPATASLATNTSTAPGEGGQNGTGSAPTKNAIGNSDRSNALGLHLKTIREAIQKNLRRPGFRLSDGSKTTSLRMKIAPSGELLEVEVHLSSGDPRLDQLAILAVKRAAPFHAYATELAITIPAIFKGDSFR